MAPARDCEWSELYNTSVGGAEDSRGLMGEVRHPGETQTMNTSRKAIVAERPFIRLKDRKATKHASPLLMV